METVMNIVIPMFKADHIQIKLFMLAKEEQTHKEWLKEVDYDYSLCTHKSKKARAVVYTTALAWFLYKEKPDMVICTNSLTCSISYLARKLTFGTYPIISWSHGSLTDMDKKENLLKADFHLAIATGIKHQLQQLNINEKNIYVIFNPCPIAKKTIPRPDEKKKFAYLGRILFGDEKRIKDIFDAFSTIEEDFELHIVGDGKDINIAKEYAKNLKINSKIIWHGWHNNPWELFIDLTAIILASTHEGFGMVLAEAASYGVYSISSDCPVGPADIIINNVNGVLFKPRDVIELNNIVINIINDTPLPDQSLIKSSIEKFHPENYYHRFKSILIEINEKWKS